MISLNTNSLETTNQNFITFKASIAEKLSHKVKNTNWHIQYTYVKSTNLAIFYVWAPQVYFFLFLVLIRFNENGQKRSHVTVDLPTDQGF